MKFKNFTPHPVNVYDAEGENMLLSIPVESNEAGKKIQVRVQEIVVKANSIDGIPVVKKSYGEAEGLPEFEKDVINIVSVVVLNALKDSRDDVVCPDTGPDSAVRDANGRILGVRRFQK